MFENKRIVDLSLPCEEHWRYGRFKVIRTMSHEEGGPWQESAYSIGCHNFTHIDWPVHQVCWGRNSDSYPIKDWCAGKCLVLDLTDVGENTMITSEMLEKANEPFKNEHYDFLFLRTDWAKKTFWKTKEFWEKSPWVAPEAGEWIKNYKPKVVGFDFAQDYDIRNLHNTTNYFEIAQPLHDIVLADGDILMIEYLTNLWEIGQPVCDIVALPIKLPAIEGAQIRVIALVDKD